MRNKDSNKLHSRLQEILETVDYEVYQQWRTSSCTKALLLMLERDNVDLRDQWTFGNYDHDSQLRASGQSFYIMNLIEDIHTMKSREEENAKS